jgi:hypothetical protein
MNSICRVNSLAIQQNVDSYLAQLITTKRALSLLTNKANDKNKDTRTCKQSCNRSKILFNQSSRSFKAVSNGSNTKPSILGSHLSSFLGNFNFYKREYILGLYSIFLTIHLN